MKVTAMVPTIDRCSYLFHELALTSLIHCSDWSFQNRSGDGMTTEVKAAIHVAASQGKDYQKTLIELLRAKDISINIVNNYGTYLDLCLTAKQA